jgi:hypothetical protein
MCAQARRSATGKEVVTMEFAELPMKMLELLVRSNMQAFVLLGSIARTSDVFFRRLLANSARSTTNAHTLQLVELNQMGYRFAKDHSALKMDKNLSFQMML